MQIVKKEIFYFNSLKVVPLWKGALKLILRQPARGWNEQLPTSLQGL